MYVCVYICMYVDLDVNICAFVHVCMRVSRVHVCTSVDVYVSIYIYIYICVCVCTCGDCECLCCVLSSFCAVLVLCCPRSWAQGVAPFSCFVQGSSKPCPFQRQQGVHLHSPFVFLCACCSGAETFTPYELSLAVLYAVPRVWHMWCPNLPFGYLRTNHGRRRK